MENIYIDQAKQLCTQCMSIGRELEQVSITQNAAEALEQISEATNLKVVVVASSHSDARAFIGELLGEDAAAWMPKLDVQKSAVIHLTYGEEPQSQMKTDEVQDIVYLDVRYNLPILEKLDLQIYVSLKSFTEYNWKKALSAADYVFMIISALRMFNQAEKSFLQTCAKKYVGASRFATVISDLEMINSKESYDDLQNTVNWQLSSNGMNPEYYEIGGETLHEFVFSNLLSDIENIHRISAEHVAQVCLDETEDMLDVLLQEAGRDTESLIEALEQLKKRSARMQEKGNLTANMAYGDISGTLTYNATQSIHQFFGQLEEEVEKTLNNTEDIQSTVALLPEYLKVSLGSFEDTLQQSLMTDATALGERLSKIMLEDGVEFLGDATLEDPEFTLIEVYNPKIWSTQLKLSENQARAKAENISKALLIGSIPAYLFTGFGGAAGTLVASRLVKKFMQDKIDMEDRANALIAVHTLLSQMEHDATLEMRESLKKLAGNVEEKVKNAYSAFVSVIMKMVTEKLASIEQAKEKRGLVEKQLAMLQELKK